MDKAAGTVVLGKTEGNVGERAGIVFAIHESLAAKDLEPRDVWLAATEDFLRSEKTKSVSWQGVVKWDGMVWCLLEVACLVFITAVAM